MEKVPKKKKRRALKKGTVLILLLAAAALTGAAAYALNRIKTPLPGRQTAESVLLLGRPMEEVESVQIRLRDEAAYTLLWRGEHFALAGHEDDALRDIVTKELRISLAELPAENTLLADLSASGSVTEADFGLKPAWSEVEITYLDGSSARVLIGNLTPNEETPQRYCMKEGDKRLFTILSADSDAFGYREEALRAFSQPGLKGDLLDRIEITGQKELALAYTPSGWLMEKPYRYPAAIPRTDSLLSRIENMRFEACLGDAQDVDLSALGLDSPELTIRLTQAASVITGETTDGETVSLDVPEQTYTLLIGAETGKSGVFAVWEGKAYKASNFLLGFWKELEPRDYLLRAPVNFLINDLTRVSFSSEQAAGAYEIEMVESITQNNQIETDEYGRVLYDCEVKRAGESAPMDAEQFTDWYVRLAALSADGELPSDFALSGESRAQIILKNDHLTRTVAFYPFDTLHDAMAVDGVALFYIQKSRVDAVMDLP
ncbi:MAG: DUF4340 domain-containing protein [Clostridia bacterium]|nr:DUF4340 domain-containing protein [Clostridia bacterium]